MILSQVRRLFFILACFSLAGCSSLSRPVQPVATEPDLVGIRLAQAAEKASSALDTIASIEQQRAPQLPPPDDYSNAPPSLSEMITVKWSGPAEQMLQTLAAKAGMKYQVKGNKPGVPLTVSLDVYQVPMIEVLRDLGLQLGRRGDISVNGTKGVIELRYAPVDRT